AFSPASALKNSLAHGLLSSAWGNLPVSQTPSRGPLRGRGLRAGAAALHAPDDQPDGAGGEQEEREAAEDDQRQRERRGASRRAVLDRARDRSCRLLVARQRRGRRRRALLGVGPGARDRRQRRLR